MTNMDCLNICSSCFSCCCLSAGSCDSVTDLFFCKGIFNCLKGDLFSDGSANHDKLEQL